MSPGPIMAKDKIPKGTPVVDSVANIHAVAELELDALRARTPIETLTERVTAAASTTAFIVGHIVWFAVWISLNTVGTWQFDPYPFNFLTLVVSLEAIVLTGFVLRDQAKMARVNDRRAHLDLQVNLLAEQELTAILRTLCGLAAHTGWDAHADNPQLEELLRQTNVHQLAKDIDRELTPAASPPSDRPPSASA